MGSKAVCTLGDFVDLVRGTTYQGALVGKPGPALLGLGAIRPGGGFRDDDFKTYGGACPAKLMLTPGDIFASLKGATKDGEMVGSVARVPTSVPSGRLTQDTVKLVFRRRGNDFEQYVYWVLRTPQYRAYCAGRATGSAVVALSRDDFLAYPIPSLTADRTQCVRLLETIEQRIAVLRQTNATLESTAQTLFRGWFVDFDPVRAKAEGREPEGMDAATAALFPTEFEESVLGLIPKGWRVKTVEDLFVLQRGFDLPAPQRTAGLVTVFAASGPHGTHHESMVRGPGVTTGRSGVLGRVFFAHEDFWPLNTSLWVKQFKAATAYYAYQYLRTMDLVRLNAGSAVPTLNRNHVHAQPAVVPAAGLVEAYSAVSAPLLQRVRANDQHAANLLKLRDALLPRLITGILRLPEAQEHLEDALA
jgi:hypothetical protein